MGTTKKTSVVAAGRQEDLLWYKDAILYELHVRAFADSNGDGMGDFPGLAAKLDYLQELGVTALWILPFYPSPWRDDGYDISDYTDVHPAYGTLKDFKAFLREAHRRGLKVVTELVVNHTSDQHPWFDRARRAEPGSRFRNFYVWSDDPTRYADARIIFKDFEASNWTWDPVAKAYYWHRFFSHQPDLNFEEPEVQRALLKALDFWMELGVDGLRLDAVPYLYEGEGTNCENLPQTHDFLKRLRAHVDTRFPGRMLLAEANQWPEDSIAYFGEGRGDECHMAFHFPVMPRLFMAIRMEDRFPIVDILQQTPPIPETCQWATFLRNHDELTLEMVTDEDRDYMYRVYAKDPRARINLGIRRRLAPLLGNDRRRIELMNALLFSLPGAPVLYYGDEIGMGDNIYLGDRNGVRTPMQWSPDRNAGFSRANPQQLYLPVVIDAEYNFASVNVEAQQGNPHSLLWWTRRMIALRKRHQAFSRGSLEFLFPGNHRVLVFLRRVEGEDLLVLANLSRFAQHVELDLSAFEGAVPVELFGRNRFPAVGRGSYPMTLGPHSFYWFSLEPHQVAARELEIAVLPVEDDWDSVLSGTGRERLAAALPEVLASRRWFGGKARTVRGVEIVETLRFDEDGLGESALVLVAIDYADGEAETYALPLAFAAGESASRIAAELPQALVARLEGGESGILYDALQDPEFCAGVVDAIGRRRRYRGDSAELLALPTSAFREIAGQGQPPVSALHQGEQSNSSVIFGERLILKLFRRLEPGVNPDLEIGRFLTERGSFPHTPRVAGSLEIRRGGEEPMTLAVLHEFVPNEGDAWSYTLDALGRYVERVLVGAGAAAPGQTYAPIEPPKESLLALAGLGRAGMGSTAGMGGAGMGSTELPPVAYEILGTYQPSAHLLGQRTAELHLALASAPDAPAFAPEPFSTLYQRSLYQSLRTATTRSLHLLEQRLTALPEEAQEDARRVLAGREQVLARFGGLLEGKLAAVRIRTHGDYHLGQVLYTGRDFVLLDFEGEPARPLGERRLKRSPLRDVAGMLRSFHYASHVALAEEVKRGVVTPGALPGLERALAAWERWASAAFLRSYLECARSGGAAFLPPSDADLALMLDVYLLEKALYELTYELNNRPDWVRIPLAGILQILGSPG